MFFHHVLPLFKKELLLISVGILWVMLEIALTEEYDLPGNYFDILLPSCPREERTRRTQMPATAFTGRNPPKLPTKHLRHGRPILHTQG